MSEIIIVPGMLDPASNFEAAVKMVEGHDVRVIDRPGVGALRDEDPLPLVPLTVEWLAEQLPDHPVSLVGHSVGGVMAAAFASKYPERVANLGLFDPYMFWEYESGKVVWGMGNDNARIVASGLVLQDVESVCSCLVDWLMGQGTWDNLGDRVQGRFLRQSYAVYADICALGFFAGRPTFAIEGITPHVLLASAKDTPDGLREVVERWAETLPNVTATDLPTGGHLSHVFNPEGFAGFLTAVGDQSSNN